MTIMGLIFVESDDKVVFSTDTLDEEENLRLALEEEERLDSLDYRNVEPNSDYWLH